MLRQLVCSTLLACSFGAHANDWQREFFSPISNELPKSRGVAVDELGFVHLQAYNRYTVGVPAYFLAHQYTIRSDGQIPWAWGLSEVDRMSNCGVYAKAGQRLDCKRSTGFWGEETRLEMRGSNNGYVVWENTLPGNVTLLAASIPQQNQALVLGRLDSPQGVRLGVYRVDSQWPAYILSLAPACAHSGEMLLGLRATMPQQPGEPIRVVKACLNSFGGVYLKLKEFDPQSGVWSTDSSWAMPLNSWVTHMEIGPQGQPYVMTEDDRGVRSLLTVSEITGQWLPVPMPIQDRVAGFFVGHQGLVIVNVRPSGQFSEYLLGPNLEYSISWLDNGAFWPDIHHFGEFEDLSVKTFALSSDGDVIVLGSSMHTRTRIDRLLLARRDRQLRLIGMSYLLPNETAVGTTYLIGGPNNTAVVARTITRDQGLGNPQIGVRVNQYDLPPTLIATKQR